MLKKSRRTVKNNLLVPIGTALTIGAFILSARATRKGDAKAANRMFIWRVALQGLTVAALVGGSYYLGTNEKWKVNRDEELL